ncbi:hypothetical protein EDC40_10544 [Aminobacter aminovorans]|uniref:Transmemrbane protein n=2 Tax=Aminobacter aminovorans TaxID=83263 RepID=A0A380WNS7_AMIAI|nr:DUF6163 family protein [Aminobacter aminovorans]TCS25847.1 hypothetical protein EDC40_10544 [Aminobacter aminovorans]SUU90488.1 Uncharacterised protein [Aminobacter aminovorans]
MTDSASRLREMHPSAIESAFALFLRVVAGYCLLFGILYWVRLIGLYDGPLWRFDLMPIHWQVAAVTLSVFFPFAAIGLWMLSSWGPVIWFICAVTEIAMYAGFPELFGSRPLIVASHIAVALIYAAFRIVLHLKRRRAAH